MQRRAKGDEVACAMKGPEKGKRRRKRVVRERNYIYVSGTRVLHGEERGSSWCATPATGARQTTFNERL